MSVISGLKRVSRPGRRTYVDSKHVPKVLGGMGTTILTTSNGRDDRSRRPHRRASAARSSPRSGSRECPASARSPSPSRPASPSRSSPRSCASPAPAATSRSASRATSRSRMRARRCLVTPADRPRRAPRAARAHALAGRQHGQGRHRRLHQDARDPGRRLPRRSSRAPTSSSRSATRTRSRSPLPRGSSSRCRSPTRVIVKGNSKQQVGEIAAIIRKQRPAGALQGQGHPLRGRVRRPEGR